MPLQMMMCKQESPYMHSSPRQTYVDNSLTDVDPIILRFLTYKVTPRVPRPIVHAFNILMTPFSTFTQAMHINIL